MERKHELTFGKDPYMKQKIYDFLAKIDYRLSPTAWSRPDYQVRLLVKELKHRHPKKVDKILDIGGGFLAQYKAQLLSLAGSYTNLEIAKGPLVDVVGSVYDLPFKKNTFTIVTLFMLMEHLAKPLDALKESHRVLKKGGFLLLTTVQYWHTHNYPSDYFRYTAAGLEYLLQEAGFTVVAIWSHGGPWLVLFHVIELNLPELFRPFFSIAFYRFANVLDWVFFRHEDRRENADSVGWSVIAQKTS